MKETISKNEAQLSVPPKGIYGKLLSIQQKVNGLGKNKDGLNYKYVTGDKVLGEIKPLMNALGLILKQEVLSIDNVRQDYTVGQGDKQRPKSEINSKVMMRFTWVDCESGEKDENLFGANGQNDWDKGVGSALTYAERYFLLKFFHIATDEDDIDNPDRKEDEKPKGDKPKEPTKELPWLNIWTAPDKLTYTKEAKNSIAKLAAGTIGIDIVKQNYRLSKETEEFLLKQIP